MDKKARPLISATALKKVRKTIEKESTPGTNPKIIAVTKTRPIEAVEAAIKENLFIIGENKSIYIPLGSTHRLSNPGKIPLILIEVQSGSYVGEDDIVRLEDVYGRPNEEN